MGGPVAQWFIGDGGIVISGNVVDKKNTSTEQNVNKLIN